MASDSPMYLGMHTQGVFTYSLVYCSVCEMMLNGMDQYNDHVLRKKHKHNLKLRDGDGRPRDRRDKGLVIPRGTAIIIEQGVILRDATEQYMHRLYSNALLRSRLGCMRYLIRSQGEASSSAVTVEPPYPRRRHGGASQPQSQSW